MVAGGPGRYLVGVCEGDLGPLDTDQGGFTRMKDEERGMNIVCGNCGEASLFSLWLELPTGESLPDDHYRCPKCNVIIRRVQGPPRVLDLIDGQEMLIPGEITIETISLAEDLHE